MNIFILISWCYFLWVQTIESVSNNVQTSTKGDTLIIKGIYVNSSDINILMTNRTISKISIYAVNTFYADEDLKLKGITECQIFAHTWNIVREVSFDLIGLDGTNQEPSELKGSAGNPGHIGMNGGNFFGLANEIINGEFLTVNLNGGNGGNGQDGTASDDIEVFFNETESSGDSGWFSTADLHNYYERYFSDRGYYTEISSIDDYTSLYAVFVHDKIANFSVTLHPLKCCGTTGLGGSGGLAGLSGTYIFKYIGSDIMHTEPKFITNVGSVGKTGRDANACKTTGLNVRVDTKLEKVVFVFLPLHHKFSSHFSVVDRVDSNKCPTKFVISNATIISESKPNIIDTASAIIGYKTFLLEHFKNASLKGIVQKTYDAIDTDNEINRKYTINAIVAEANVLEQKFFELEKSIDLVPLYQRLLERIELLPKGIRENGKLLRDFRNAPPIVRSILSTKMMDLQKEYNLIINLELYHEVPISYIEGRKESVGQNLNISDVQLRTNVNELQFNVNANYVLATYYHFFDGFKFAFFPFAAEFLEMYELSSSLSTYADINALISVATSNIKSLVQRVRDVHRGHMVVSKNSLNSNDTEHAFYVWKNSEVRDDIRRLFAGEKVTFLADINQSRKTFNAFKFNVVDLVFRTPNQSTNNYLTHILNHFEIQFLVHSGVSDFRCNNDFYKITSQPISIDFSFQKSSNQNPMSWNLVYSMLKENRPFLSPYTEWEMQLVIIYPGRHNIRFDDLDSFVDQVDMELHGTGEYLRENASICNNIYLSKFYALM